MAFGGGSTNQQFANGFNWAKNNGMDVISCSWGGGSPSDIMNNGINNALTQGRDGKGCVVVFSAGNSNLPSVGYPANANSLILAVGAMSPNGMRKNTSSCDGENWWGSNYGSALDVVAPGVKIPTTDRQGAAGYAPGDYYLTFNGTSSACPHVAGVAALVLSVNPFLTAAEVNNIIEKTAQKVGSYSYSTTSGRPNGTWHSEMGYGLVNAYEAVSLAQRTGCPENINITTPITTNRNYQVSNQITASSVISNNLNVNFRGKTIVLKPGFKASGGNFRAYIDPCITLRNTILADEDSPYYNIGPDMDYNTDHFTEISIKAKNENIKVYPNPTNDIINIEIPNLDENTKLNLYNLNGQLVLTESILKNKTQLDLTTLNNGVYFLRVISQKTNEVIKIIKN